MQQTRDQLCAMITDSFESAHRQVHARNMVKQLVGAVAKYFPHVTHNSMIATRDIALKSLSKAILATDYQPIPKFESWILHRVNRLGQTLNGLRKESGDRLTFPEMIVSYADTETGLALMNDEMDGWGNTEESLKRIRGYINVFGGSDKKYELGGHHSSMTVSAVLETILVYLQAQTLGDEPGMTKLSSSFVSITHQETQEIDSVHFVVDDQANNLFVRISLIGLV